MEVKNKLKLSVLLINNLDLFEIDSDIGYKQKSLIIDDTIKTLQDRILSFVCENKTSVEQ